MQDIIKQVGASKASKPDAGGANVRTAPVLGIVKNNVDPIRAGRLEVYVADFGSNDPDDASAWVTVSYMSPFFGSVEPNGPNTDEGTFITNPSSYGLWNSPPDIGSTVVCIFINGDPNYGFYIGCVPKPEVLYMVPAIGAAEKIVANNQREAEAYGGATRLPVTNLNTNNENLVNNPDFLKRARPVHSYSAAIMSQQGIIRDAIRGPISSSAQRETPSRVGWGVSTPGRPIYEGGFTDASITPALNSKATAEQLKIIGRRGGHSIVMDDGDLDGQDQLIRIRTAKGHQITMSDDGQTLFIIHSNGQSYIELGKEGTIDLYSTNSVNVRTQGDLNLHADNDVNIHAAKKMNIYAQEMNIQTEKNTTQKIGGNYVGTTIGTHTHKVLGPMSFKSNGDSSFASSADTYINGAKINLNTGSSSTTPESAQPIQQISHSDTLHDSSKGWVAAPAKLKSVTSRAPAHAPWADAGKGVNVKVNNSSSAALPPEPSPKIQATNAVAAATQQGPSVQPANIATVPSAASVSKSIDSTTNSAMVGAAAQAAAAVAPNVAKTGAAIINSTTGPQAVIGALGQTPKQLEMAGILKPGSASLITSLIKTGTSIAKAIPPNMFTGKSGINDINGYVKNINAQVNTQTTNYQIAQTGLTASGVITGKESSTAIAGLVMAGSSLGLGPTLRNVQQVITAGSRLPAAGVPGTTNEVTKIINAGMYAATVAQSLGGGRAAASAVTTMKQLGKLNAAVGLASRGASTSAFVAILDAIKPLIPNTPQDLRKIAQDSANSRKNFLLPSGTAQTINTVAKVVGGKTGSLINTGVGVASAIDNLSRAQSVTGTINAASQVLRGVSILNSTINSPATATSTRPIARPAPSVASSVFGVAKSIGTLTNDRSSASSKISAAVNLVGGISSIVTRMSSSASGLNNLPGGGSLSSTPGIINIPQTSTLSTLVKNASTAAISGSSLQTSINGMTGPVGSAIGSATNALSLASSKLLADLKSGANTLSSIAMNGLSPDAAAVLNSSIASTAATPGTSTTLPVSSEATFDRSGIDAQTTALLGDTRIPAPDFSISIPTAETLAAEQTIENLQSAILEKQNEISSMIDKRQELERQLGDLTQTLPAGDPQLNVIKQDIKISLLETQKLEAELEQLLTA